MVSKASEDLPEQASPVNTTSWSRGISRSMFLRLCSRAPRIAITRALSSDPGRRGRFLSNRSFIGSVGAIRSARSRKPHAPRADWKERSENDGLSPARPPARALFRLCASVDNARDRVKGWMAAQDRNLGQEQQQCET